MCFGKAGYIKVTATLKAFIQKHERIHFVLWVQKSHWYILQTAVLLLTVLKQSGWLDLKPIPKDPSTMENKDPNILQFTQTDLYIGSLLLRHIEQLVCNAHAITELLVTETSNSSLVDSKSQERIATAIYPTTSLLNHSCDPSIIPGYAFSYLIAISNIQCIFCYLSKCTEI